MYKLPYELPDDVIPKNFQISATKHSIEKPTFLNFKNSPAIFSPVS